MISAASDQPEDPRRRLVDYGRFNYEQAKRDKETKKRQHVNKVKEVPLRPVTDPHDFQTELEHAIHFLSDGIKVKVSLRFRGRENMLKEAGAQTVDKFIEAIAPWGRPEPPPLTRGRSISA